MDATKTTKVKRQQTTEEQRRLTFVGQRRLTFVGIPFPRFLGPTMYYALAWVEYLAGDRVRIDLRNIPTKDEIMAVFSSPNTEPSRPARMVMLDDKVDQRPHGGLWRRVNADPDKSRNHRQPIPYRDLNALEAHEEVQERHRKVVVDAAAVLGRMTPAQRKIFLMKAEGMKPSEISRRLGISRKTVSTQIARLNEKILKNL